MSDVGRFFGEVKEFGCQVVPLDRFGVRRVGEPGSEMSAVGLMMECDEPDFIDDDRVGLSVVLSAADARRLIGALLEIVDETDGNFSTLLDL